MYELFLGVPLVIVAGYLLGALNFDNNHYDYNRRALTSITLGVLAFAAYLAWPLVGFILLWGSAFFAGGASNAGELRRAQEKKRAELERLSKPKPAYIFGCELSPYGKQKAAERAARKIKP